MKLNKKIVLIAGIIMLVMTMRTPMTSADGMHFSSEYYHLHEPSQKAVIYWNGISETLILSSAARSNNLTDIAWVVPIISYTIPNVTAGNMSIFKDLVKYFRDVEKPRYGKPIYLSGNDAEGVSVLETKEIDIYDVIILRAANASDLIDWLSVNDFKIPEEAHSIIEEYVNKEHCYFVINKIDLKNRFKEVLEDIENDNVYYDSSDYREFTQVLSDLRTGMATPLKFVFTPPMPYYPLTISSLNAGYGTIEVYVIAEHPVTDQNRVMNLDHCKPVNQALQEKLSQYFNVDKANYVTRLSYHGKLEELANDAVFSYFPLSKPESPILVYHNGDFEVVIAEQHIWGIAEDQKGEVIEVQYRFDEEETWRITNGTKLWNIDLQTIFLTNGEHTLQVRVLRKNWMSYSYSNVSSFTFSTLDGNAVTFETLDEYNINNAAFLLSGLVVLLVATAAVVISRKITCQ